MLPSMIMSRRSPDIRVVLGKMRFQNVLLFSSFLVEIILEYRELHERKILFFLSFFFTAIFFTGSVCIYEIRVDWIFFNEFVIKK